MSTLIFFKHTPSNVNRLQMRNFLFFSLQALFISCTVLHQAHASESLAVPAQKVQPSAQPAQPNPTTAAVEIHNGAKPGTLELQVHRTIELDSRLNVEMQQSDGSFQFVRSLDFGSMKLVTHCDQMIDACVKINPGMFRPVPWSGMSCSSQCSGACDKNTPKYGRYRFVVKTCAGKSKFEGPVFEFTEKDFDR